MPAVRLLTHPPTRFAYFSKDQGLRQLSSVQFSAREREAMQDSSHYLSLHCINSHLSYFRTLVRDIKKKLDAKMEAEQKRRKNEGRKVCYNFWERKKKKKKYFSPLFSLKEFGSREQLVRARDERRVQQHVLCCCCCSSRRRRRERESPAHKHRCLRLALQDGPGGEEGGGVVKRKAVE